MSTVSLARIHKNTIESIKQAISKTLDLIDFRFTENERNIVIKPNLCYYWDYSTGQTTDPRFIAALVELLHEKISSDVNISLVESDASAMKCNRIFRFLGYQNIQHLNVNLVNLSEQETEKVKVAVEGLTFHLEIPQLIRKADLTINVPKIKYAGEKVRITCALKNIFGCNPYPRKYRYHPWLDETIVAVNKAMPFDLTIVDANIVSGIQPRRLGLVMTGKDPVAIDTAAARIAGVNPRAIGHLQLAAREGLGKTSFVAGGEPLRYFAQRYPRPAPRNILLGKANSFLASSGLGTRLGLA